MIILAPMLAFLAAVLIFQYLYDRDLRMYEPGLETCSIEGCDTILRGHVYVWERGPRTQRLCPACASEMQTLWPALVIRPA